MTLLKFRSPLKTKFPSVQRKEYKNRGVKGLLVSLAKLRTPLNKVSILP